MLVADLRATLAAVAVAVVALSGEIWFSNSYLTAGLVLSVIAFLFVVDQRVTLSTDEWVGLCLLAWGALSAFVASSAWMASKTTLASWFGAWLIWVVISRGRSTGRSIVFLVLVVTASFSGAAIVAEFIGSKTPRAAGLITNPNITVAMVASMLGLVWGRISNRWFGVAIGAVLAVPIVLTGSRAGLLAIGVAALMVLPPGAKRRAAAAVAAVGLGTAALWRTVANPESLAWHRWSIWGAVIEMISNRPLFGIGAGHLGEAMGLYRLPHANEIGHWGHIIGSAESMPLGIAARIGIPGLVFMLVAVGLWISRCRVVDGATRSVLATIVVVGAFHDFSSEPAALWWWAAVLALVTPRASCPADLRDVGARRIWTGTATAGLAGWALLQPVWAMVQWDSAHTSTDAVARALRIEPWFSDPMRYRVEELLRLAAWDWDQASEARYWNDRLLEVRPGAAWAWAQRGRLDSRIIAELGAWRATIDEARAAFSTASALEPRLPWYPYEHALLERGIGELDRARGLARRSVESEPNFVRGWLLLARLELDRGDVLAAEEARSAARSAIAIGAARARSGYQAGLLEYTAWQLESLSTELP